MDRYFRGILVQAGSPGYDEFVQAHGEQVASKGLQQVAAAFGDDFVDIPIDVKYELVSDLGTQKAGAMLQAHGQAFVDLYSRERRAVTDVMRNTRYAEIMADVFNDERPTVAFYKHSLDRLGSLDAQQTHALILIRQLHPTKKAEEINKDALTIIGASASRLAAIKTQNPQAAAATVDWVLHGQMSGTLLNRLAAHGHAATLLSLPLYLGPDTVTQMLGVADEATILKFLADFTPPGESHARAMAYLREDAAGHLKSYSAPTGAVPRLSWPDTRCCRNMEAPFRPRRTAPCTGCWLILPWSTTRFTNPPSRAFTPWESRVGSSQSSSPFRPRAWWQRPDCSGRSPLSWSCYQQVPTPLGDPGAPSRT